MDDLTGRGASAGPVPTAGYTAHGYTTHLDDDRDWTDSEMTTIIPIDEFTPSWDHERGHRPTRSEITQDIVIPETEFDAYSYDDPRDIDGAHLDTVTLAEAESDGALTALDAKPFRTKPATAGEATRRRGRHRLAAPPNTLKGGRAALVAMAAGAALAAVAVGTNTDSTTTPTNAANVDPAGQTPDLGPGVATASPTKDMDTFTDQLAVGKQLAAAEAARENLLRRPLFISPLPLGQYQFTSTFAMRWGSFHGGIDFAAPLGTPIHAATDGVVIEAGPASGYGNWVQVRAADGTVTMYGHMASSGVLVQKGQHVTAGDVIALVGSEGFSTGPHCHFEVWKNGTTKIDPAPWLAAHGVRMSAYVGG